MSEVLRRECRTCGKPFKALPEYPWWEPTCECGGPEKSWPRYYLVIRCACKRELELMDGWLNECLCGRDYNGSAQLLAPREQWGEETGETLADIMNPSLD